MKKFPMTTSGCIKATAYLKRIGKWEVFLRSEQSTDGYTIVAAANDQIERSEAKEKSKKAAE